MSNTIANLRRPTKAASAKGEPPAEPTIVNLHKPATAGHVQLQFQVPPEIRRAVKAHAAENDLSMSEVFLQMWTQFRNK